MKTYKVSGALGRMLLTLAVLASVVLWAAAPAVAETTTVGTHTVTYYGVRYDYPSVGESTWYYSVTSVGSPAISHVVFAMPCDWIRILDAGLWNGGDILTSPLSSGAGAPDPGIFPAKPQRDPTTGVTGLKFDEGFEQLYTKYYYFTVDGNYAEETIDLAIKAGGNERYGSITGPSLDCSLVAKASLGDYVWLDANQNGIQDAGEAGVQGAQVELFDSGNNPLGTTTTDVNGYYLFDNLDAGDYYVIFTRPIPLYQFTSQDQGADDAKDSDANPLTGQTQVVSLSWGEDYRDLDAGIYVPGTPSAVTVSSFEVLRENDTLRFKWRTEQELDNRGFDIFAVDPTSGVWIQVNAAFIPGTGVGEMLEPQEYYYQVDRPDIAVGAGYILRAYGRDGTHEDLGPVQAVHSAAVTLPVPPAPSAPSLPCTPGEEGCRPVAGPRSETVPAPETSRPQKLGPSKSLPVIGPEEPQPMAPQPRIGLEPGPINGKQS